jgi:hypothetical protein
MSVNNARPVRPKTKQGVGRTDERYIRPPVESLTSSWNLRERPSQRTQPG